MYIYEQMKMYTSQVIQQLKHSDQSHKNGYLHKVVVIIMTAPVDFTPFPHPLLAMSHPSPSRASTLSTTHQIRCSRNPPSPPRLYLPLVSHMMHIRRARTFRRWLQLKRSRRDYMMHMLGMYYNLVYYTLPAIQHALYYYILLLLCHILYACIHVVGWVVSARSCTCSSTNWQSKTDGRAYFRPNLALSSA